jgi:TetR/AcrR family transcriptional regulator
MPKPSAKTRDAERSKVAILEAATRLFSERGFDATGIGDIAAVAGVARGTPAYFFGSKEALFEAVMDQLNTRSLEIVPPALARVGTQPTPTQLINVFVDAYLDFHEANPEFLRLIHWISLSGNRLLPQAISHWNTLASMLSAVVITLKGTALENDDPRQMVLTIIGMCNAHLTYGSTVATPLGLQHHDPEFLSARKAHLKHVLINLVQGSSP